MGRRTVRWVAAAVILGVAACSSPAAKRAGQAHPAPATAAPVRGGLPGAGGVPGTTVTTAPPAMVAPATTVTTVAPTMAAPATTATTGTTSTTVPPVMAIPTGWNPLGPVVNGQPALVATFVPSRPGGPVVGVVRMNAAVTRPVLYAGTAEPGGTWPNQGAVPAAQRASLVAAFNSGFHTYASGGGWFDQGRTAVALQPGAASLVIRADGSATVGAWGRDVSLTPDVVSVRQNLQLLVDGAVTVAGAGNWGATLGGVRYTWRSGLGVDAVGNLIYAGGPGLDALSLGQVLSQAGAVRAMELDINPQWVCFSYYAAPGGADLVPGTYFGPDHWLSGSAHDFLAVFTR